MLTEKKKRIGAPLVAGVAALCLALLVACAGDRAGDAVANREEVIAGIRQGLLDYSSRITVSFAFDRELPLPELTALAADWMEAAMAETGDPVEGDYIRYQIGGYESTCGYTEENGAYAYTLEIVPDYYMYLFQEEAVTERFEEIFDAFGFDGTESEYDRLRTIYDYICGSVRYDLIHRKNPYYRMCSTSYAAMIGHTATCQGYCVAMYRMLRMAGIDCRIVTGTAGEEYHAWLIAALDGLYYNLDPTWDAGAEEYAYFLRGSDSFSDHTPGEAFTAPAFRARYPQAKVDYAPPTRAGQ